LLTQTVQMKLFSQWKFQIMMREKYFLNWIRFQTLQRNRKVYFEKDFDEKCIFNAKIKQTSPRPSFKININVAVTLSWTKFDRLTFKFQVYLMRRKHSFDLRRLLTLNCARLRETD